MKYYVIVGESSGDQHGADLIRAIKALDKDASFYGMGGPKLQEAGMHLDVDFAKYNVMGFWEVARQYRSFKKLFATITKRITALNPDRVILIDYGGFNMRVGQFCKQNGLEVHFYILPKIWAWNEARIRKLKPALDAGYAILPFEEAYFKAKGLPVTYVGNPVAEQLSDSKREAPIDRQDFVALLPGSRAQEIKRSLPIMLRYAQENQDKSFVIIAANNTIYDLDLPHNVRVDYRPIEQSILGADCAIVMSGTASLQAALLDIPHVVCYKANQLSYWLGKQLIRVKYISLVNLILDKLVIKELIQDAFNVLNLTSAVEALKNNQEREAMLRDFAQIRRSLTSKAASHKTAELIVKGV